MRWFDLPLAGVLILIATRLARGSPLRALAGVLVAAALAAYAAYLAAGASWDYHRYPFGVFAIATLALPLLRPLSRGPVALGLAGAVGAASLLIAPLDLRAPQPAGREWAGWSQGAATAEILRLVGSGPRVRSIFLFSTSRGAGLSGRELRRRGLGLALLVPLAAPGGDPLCERIPRSRRSGASGSRRSSACCGRPCARISRVPGPSWCWCRARSSTRRWAAVELDLLAFFERDPDFAKVWSGYQQREETPLFRVYALRQP